MSGRPAGRPPKVRKVQSPRSVPWDPDLVRVAELARLWGMSRQGAYLAIARLGVRPRGELVMRGRKPAALYSVTEINRKVSP